MEKETKRCPYCGEEILAVAKKCKHCGEWLEKKELKECPICGEMIDSHLEVCPHCEEPTQFTIDKETQSHQGKEHEVSNDGSFLYCKQCKERISVTVNKCPKCGEEDPFLFQAAELARKYTHLGWIKIIVIAMLLTLIYQFFGSPHGILGWSTLEVCIYLGVLFILEIAGSVIYDKTIKNYFERMNKIFTEKKDAIAPKIWTNIVHKK